MPRARAYNIQTFKLKYGNFDKLEQILEVEGIGIKMLKKICQSIINPVSVSSK